MIRYGVRQGMLEIGTLLGISQPALQILQLSTNVENEQSEEAVDRGVTHGGHHEGESLCDERELEVWALVGVVKVVRL